MGQGDFFSGEQGSVEESSTLAPWQQALTGDLNKHLKRPVGEMYDGELNAGKTNMMNMSLAALEEWSKGSAKESMGTYSDLMNRDYEGDWQTYFETSIEKPTLEKYQKDILPELLASDAGSGTLWSSRSMENQDRSMESLTDSLEQARAQTAYQAWEKGIDTKLQAAGGAQEVVGGLTEVWQASLGDQQLEQDALDRTYNEWMRAQTDPDIRSQLIIDALNVQTKAFMWEEPTSGIWGAAASGIGGQGPNEGSNNVSACCFIFIAAHGGILHPVVRWYRDKYMTVRNRRGYYWLADRLVPQMKKRKWLMRLVQIFMVNPMTSYGKYRCGYNKIGAIFAPVSAAWQGIFTLLGCRKSYRRRGSQEVV